MNKVLTYLGILFIAQLVFVGLVHGLLRVQGKDSPETYETLHGMPVIGGFFTPPAPTEPEPTEEQRQQAKVLRRLVETRDFFELPPGFTREQLDELIRKAKDARTRYTQEILRLEEEREKVVQGLAEVESERTALIKAGEDLERQAAEVQARIDELEARSLRIDADEIRNLKVVADSYAQMPVDQAAMRLEQLGADTAAKILKSMGARKSGKVLAAMDVPFAVEVTRRIQSLTLMPDGGATDSRSGGK